MGRSKKDTERSIELKDLEVIQEIAKKYNMSMQGFGRELLREFKVTKERQYRVSAEEVELIKDRAEACGLSVMEYGAAACEHFLKKNELDPAIIKFEIGSDSYGQGRDKRANVVFANEDVEVALEKMADENKIPFGSLVRYCVLKYKRRGRFAIKK